MKEHISDRGASFMIIEKICGSTLNRETKKNLLKQRQNFRIGKLEKSFSQSRFEQIKGSNECTSIVRNVHFSSVYFDQSNSPLY